MRTERVLPLSTPLLMYCRKLEMPWSSMIGHGALSSIYISCHRRKSSVSLVAYADQEESSFCIRLVREYWNGDAVFIEPWKGDTRVLTCFLLASYFCLISNRISLHVEIACLRCPFLCRLSFLSFSLTWIWQPEERWIISIPITKIYEILVQMLRYLAA